MARRRRRFDESKVRRWPAESPDSKGGEFAPKTSAPRWAMAVAARLPSGVKKTVRRSGGGGAGAPAAEREPDLFDEGERRFRGEPTRRGGRERYEQGQLIDTSGKRQRPGQMSMLDELGNIDTSSVGPAGGGSKRVNPKDIRVNDTIIIRRRDYTPEGPLGPERVEEHIVARVEHDRSTRPPVWRFYDSAGNPVKAGHANSKIEVRPAIGPGGEDRGTGTGPFAFPRGSEGWNLRYAAGLATGMDAHQAAIYADSGLTYDQFKALGVRGGDTDPTPDIARMDAYESAVRTLDASSVSERGREFAMRKLGGLTLGVSAKDVASTLREGIGRSGHTKADNAVLETLAASLERPRHEPPRFDPNAQPPGFVEPPHPEPPFPTDPAVLFDQAVAYAEALSAMRRPDGAGYFRVLPELTDLNGLTSGVEPAEVVRRLKAKAKTHPEEWAGGREYLNRLAGFLSLQSTTLPKAEGDKRRARRARWEGVLKEAGGDRYWDLSTMTGAGTVSGALAELQIGRTSPAEVAQNMRMTAQSLENRANAGHIQDYDRVGVLAYGDEANKAAGLADARRLRKLADAIEAAEPARPRGGAVPATAADRKKTVAKHAKLSRAEFDAMPQPQRAQILDELRLVAESGDKARAKRDSMGSLVRGGDADHVIQARSLHRALSEPARPTREQEFDALVARLKRGEGDLPPLADRAQLVKLDEALGLGQSTMGRPTAAKLRERMQAELKRRRASGGGEPLTMPELAKRLQAAETNEEIGQLFPEGMGLSKQQLVELAGALEMPIAGRPNAKQLETLLRNWVAIRPMGMFSTDPDVRRKAQRLLDDQKKITDEIDRVAAARRRQALIDDAKRWGDLAAEYAELLDAQVSDDALKRRLRADSKRLGLDGFEVGAVINDVDSGRRWEAQRKLAALLKRNGVELVGEPGTTVPLDRKRYVGTDGSGLPADVTAVRIIRPAYTVTLPDGEVVTVRGVAEPADVGPDFQIQQQILGLKTAVAMRQFARDRGDKVPAYLKTKDQIREWLQQQYHYPPGMDFDEYAERIRVKPAKQLVPPSGRVREELLKLSTDAERRAYLAGLDFKSQAEANRLAKALGARQTRISVDATLDNIVDYFNAARPERKSPSPRRSSGGFTRASARDGDIVEWRPDDSSGSSGETARGVVSVERRGKVTKVFVQWDGGRKEQIKTGEKYPNIHVVEGEFSRGTRAIREVMERESPEGILDQVKEAGSQDEADRILRRIPPHRLFLVADAAGIRVGENDTSDQVRRAIVREWAGAAARRGGDRPFGGDRRRGAAPALDLNDEAELRWLDSAGQYDPNRAHRHLAGVEKRVQAQIDRLEPLVAAGYVRKDSKGIYRTTDKARKTLAAARQARLDTEAEMTGKPVTPVHADDHFIRGGQPHREDLARRIIAAAEADPDWNATYGGEETVRGDMYGNYLAAEQGFDGPPQVVTPEQFAELRRDGQIRTVLYRGVGGGNRAMPAEDVHREWRVGRYRHGLGTFGNGTYMAVRRAHAAEYGEVGQFGLRKGSRVINWDQLLKEMEQWSRRVRARDDYDNDPEWNMYGDPGRYAMARGYDAIFVPAGSKPGLGREAGGDQYVILNRTAIISAVPPQIEATEDALRQLTRAELATRAENMLGGDTSVQTMSKADLIRLIVQISNDRTAFGNLGGTS